MQPHEDAALNRLATDLFREFARMEYALKAANFHSGDGDAKPDWRKFALSVGTALTGSQSNEVRQAVKYVLAHPPKKQVVRDGMLGWHDAPIQTDCEADRILQYVRRVRNNLFHGGKFNGRWFKPERSEELLRHSLVILRACREASPEVRAAYDSN